MAKRLKEKNKPTLYALITTNLVIYYALSQGVELLSGAPIELLEQIQKLLPAGFGLLLTGVINALVNANLKAKIASLRWANPLPGTRAFRPEMLKADPRIDVACLEDRFGAFTESPEEQNAIWYKIYRRHISEPAVMEAHKNFLFTRDYTVLVLLITLVLVPLAFYQFPSKLLVFAYLAGMLAQYAAAMLAARNNGNRFVLSGLAIEAASGTGVNSND